MGGKKGIQGRYLGKCPVEIHIKGKREKTQKGELYG